MQEGALWVMLMSLETDLVLKLQVEETDQVIEPYATAAVLPSDWAEHRERILKTRVETVSIMPEPVAQTAEQLRQNFIAVVENRGSGTSHH